MVTIYGLVCPLSNEIRYIGKTSRTPEIRLKGHLSESRFRCTSHKHRWLRKLMSAGLAPHVWMLEKVEDGESWQARERAWISRATDIGIPLVNQTKGGEGLDYLDPEQAKAQRENWSKAMEAYRQTEAGQKQLQNMMCASRSPEARAKRREALAKVMATSEYKKKASIASKRMHSRPEVKKANSESKKKLWQSKEGREKFMSSFKTPECKAAQREAKVRSWMDPDYRQKMMSRWTPEARAKQAEEIKGRREKMLAAMTPEVRATQGAKMKEFWANNPDHGKRCQAGRTPEGNKRISEANKRRWAEYRARKASQ